MALKQFIRMGYKALGLAAVALLPTFGVAADSLPFEYKLKAVFLLNFAKFVSWPASAFPDASAPLYICVIGEDPFGPLLDQAVQGETAQSHALKVIRPSTDRDYHSCHIAFFSQSTEAQVATLLSKHIAPHTLTVGDHDKFLRQGGMVNFTVEETKVRFVINTTPLSQAKFEISSKLLSLGRAEQY